MPVRMGWGDADQSYIYVQFMGNWTWNEFYQVQQGINGMIDSSPRPVVSVMMNFADTQHVPPRPLNHMLSMGKNWNRRCDMLVMTGVPKTLSRFVDMMLKHFPHLKNYVRMTDTHRHATDELNEERAFS